MGLFDGATGGEIRTRDFLTPSQARYQAALRPDTRARVAGAGRSVDGAGPDRRLTRS